MANGTIRIKLNTAKVTWNVLAINGNELKRAIWTI